jgi:hypothetical protein
VTRAKKARHQCRTLLQESADTLSRAAADLHAEPEAARRLSIASECCRQIALQPFSKTPRS